jgi:hypothetical protein
MSQKERKGLNRFKKMCMVTLLAAGMLASVAGGARAIEFKAQGEWLVGFGVGDASLAKTNKDTDGVKTKGNDADQFGAAQRIRLQLDAVASEALSGTVYFEIGDQTWGKSEEGGALGADGNNQIKVKNAYIDWLIPQTQARVRMRRPLIFAPLQCWPTLEWIIKAKSRGVAPSGSSFTSPAGV